MTLTVGSLFSGIGGLDYGLEQAGLETIWQVEYDDWAREMLNQNFPNTKKYKDVKEVGKHNLEKVDLIAGGFPCQDISTANQNGRGLQGKRSGLWFEYFRIIRELRPRYTLIENVPKLLILGAERVISDLTSIGYDTEWQTIRASTFGLSHRRKRLFIIAYPHSIGRREIIFHTKRGVTRLQKLFCAPYSYIQDTKNSYPQIPKHLRMDDGISYELPEIKKAIKGYGNAVAPPVAKWLGEQIIRFEKKQNDKTI